MGDTTRIPKISIVTESGALSSGLEETSNSRPRTRRVSRSPSPRRGSKNDDVEAPHFEIFKFNKDTVFQTGEGICGKCKNKIFAAEKVWGPGEDNPYHKDCLICEMCEKRLETSTMEEHDNKAYCIACYNKHFAPLAKL